MAGRLEPAAEAALGLADALGHRSHLAVALGQQHDDPVGLTQLDGAQHHPLVAVEGHRRRGRIEGDASSTDAEPAVPALELADGLEQVLSAEVGPQHVGEHQLAVGQLPEQEVGDPELAGGADDQIRIGHVRLIEVPGDGPLVDLGRRHPGGDQCPHGIDDLGPASVVEGEDERHTPVVLGQVGRLVHLAQHPSRDPPVPASGEDGPARPVRAVRPGAWRRCCRS